MTAERGVSESLVMPALLVEVLEALDDAVERPKPLVQLLVELIGRNWGAAGRVSRELRVEVGTVGARLHRDLRAEQAVP